MQKRTEEFYRDLQVDYRYSVQEFSRLAESFLVHIQCLNSAALGQKVLASIIITNEFMNYKSPLIQCLCEEVFSEQNEKTVNPLKSNTFTTSLGVWEKLLSLQYGNGKYMASFS
jgi:hypothetical protein